MTAIEWAAIPLKKYATFSGRAPRAEYWWFYLATLIVQIPFSIVDWIVKTETVSTIYNLALIVPFFSVSARRFHDVGWSGWWLFAPIVTIAIFTAAVFVEGGDILSEEFPEFSVGMAISLAITGALLILWFALTVIPGNSGPNRYGPDPYGRDNLEDVFA